MKTGKYYFDLLSKEEKARFEINIDEPNFFNELMNTESTGLSQLIREAFIWYKTSEGIEFWKEIANR